jgi:hypothetical protein
MVFTPFPARNYQISFFWSEIVMEGGVSGYVPQANWVVGILAGDLHFVTLTHYFTMLEGIQKRLLSELIIAHFVKGVTGEDQLSIPECTPTEDLSEHICYEALECLFHNSPSFLQPTASGICGSRRNTAYDRGKSLTLAKSRANNERKEGESRHTSAEFSMAYGKR